MIFMTLFQYKKYFILWHEYNKPSPIVYGRSPCQTQLQFLQPSFPAAVLLP